MNLITMLGKGKDFVETVELGREAFCGDRIRKSEVPCPFRLRDSGKV